MRLRLPPEGLDSRGRVLVGGGDAMVARALHESLSRASSTIAQSSDCIRRAQGARRVSPAVDSLPYNPGRGHFGSITEGTVRTRLSPLERVGMASAPRRFATGPPVALLAIGIAVQAYHRRDKTLPQIRPWRRGRSTRRSCRFADKRVRCDDLIVVAVFHVCTCFRCLCAIPEGRCRV